MADDVFISSAPPIGATATGGVGPAPGGYGATAAVTADANGVALRDTVAANQTVAYPIPFGTRSTVISLGAPTGNNSGPSFRTYTVPCTKAEALNPPAGLLAVQWAPDKASSPGAWQDVVQGASYWAVVTAGAGDCAVNLQFRNSVASP